MEGSGKTEDKPHWLEPVQGNREETPMGTSKINGAEDLITEPQQTWAVAVRVSLGQFRPGRLHMLNGWSSANEGGGDYSKTDPCRCGMKGVLGSGLPLLLLISG